MEVRERARKHGIDDADMLHAFDNHIRYVSRSMAGKYARCSLDPTVLVVSSSSSWWTVP